MCFLWFWVLQVEKKSLHLFALFVDSGKTNARRKGKLSALPSRPFGGGGGFSRMEREFLPTEPMRAKVFLMFFPVGFSVSNRHPFVGLGFVDFYVS